MCPVSAVKLGLHDALAESVYPCATAVWINRRRGRLKSPRRMIGEFCQAMHGLALHGAGCRAGSASDGTKLFIRARAQGECHARQH